MKYGKDMIKDIQDTLRCSSCVIGGPEGNETNETGAIIEQKMAENFPN